MKKLVGVSLLVAFVAAPAIADLSSPRDRSLAPIFEAAVVGPVGEIGTPRAGGPAAYDSLGPGAEGFFAAPPSLGPLGFDDYATNSGTVLTSLMFVGGMTGTGGILWFEYYSPTTTGFTFFDSFGVIIPQAGNFIWTINLGSSFHTIPHTGLFQIVANSTFTGGGGTFYNDINGQWFLTSTDALVVGANDTAIGGGSAYSTTAGYFPLFQSFSFHVPEPATVGLLGIGLLMVIRSRRS